MIEVLKFTKRIVKIYKVVDRRGGVMVERSPRMRGIRVRTPIGTDLSLLNR